MRRLVAAYTHTRGMNELAIAFIGIVLAGMNLGLGLSLLRAGPLRTSAASFDVIKDAAPMHSWGWAFIITGVAAILAQVSMRLVPLAVVHIAAGLICLFWCVAFKMALIAPAASVTGPWAYGAIGLIHLTVAGATIVEAYFEEKARQLTAPADD